MFGEAASRMWLNMELDVMDSRRLMAEGWPEDKVCCRPECL